MYKGLVWSLREGEQRANSEVTWLSFQQKLSRQSDSAEHMELYKPRPLRGSHGLSGENLVLGRGVLEKMVTMEPQAAWCIRRTADGLWLTWRKARRPRR